MVQAIVSWSVPGTIIVVLLGVGFGVLSMTPPRHRITEVCFSVAALILWAKFSFWAVTSTVDRREKLAASALVFGLSGMVLVLGLSWIESMLLPVRESKAPPMIEPKLQGEPSPRVSRPPLYESHEAPILKPPPKSPAPLAIGPRLGIGPEAYKEISDEQVGQWAMEEADKITELASRSMAERGMSPNAAIWRFTNEFNDCCAQDLKELRTEILRRLGPPAKDPDEISAWTVVFPELKYPELKGHVPERINPGAVTYYAPYLRRLGLRLKRRGVPRSAPIALHFSEKLRTESAKLPVGAVRIASEFSGEPHQQFPFGTIVTITTTTPFSSGYIVIEFDSGYAGAGCDFVDSRLVVGEMRSVENRDLADYLEAHQFRTYALAIGRTAFTPDKPIHVEAFGNNPLHVLMVTHFDE